MTLRTVELQELLGPGVSKTVEKGETCDRCGPAVRASVTVHMGPSETLPNGGKLTFCNHCFTEHELPIYELFAVVMA
jgi:hypothetical protein